MAQSIWSNRKTAQQSLRAAAEDLAGEIATLNTLEPVFVRGALMWAESVCQLSVFRRAPY